MYSFIELPNIVGNSNATDTTVCLFNATRIRQKDSNGYYLLTAIKPHKNGVIVEKQYIKQ